MLKKQNSPTLEVTGLHKTYPGGRKALSGVSFAVRAGERVALLGPNGAGKTSLVKIIAGLLSPDAGGVRYRGRALTRRERGRIGFLFEEANNLYGNLTVWENLLFYGRLAGTPELAIRQRARQELDELGLAGQTQQLAQQLSRGQKQKLALISLLVQQAELVVLDEPTLGLDLAAQEQLSQKLLTLAPMLLTTHDPVLVFKVASRVLVIKDGGIVRDAALSDLKEQGVDDPEALRGWLLEMYQWRN